MNRTWTIPNTINWSTPNEVRKSWDRKIPYHLQFRDHFAQMIAKGSLLPGQKLPTERALADQFSINRNRLRTIDGRVVLVEQIYIKANRCPNLFDHALDHSMTRLLAEKYNILEQRSQINMRPTALSEIPAKALGVTAGTPSFYLSRAILDQHNEVVEFDQEFWRQDAIDICVSATENSGGKTTFK
jgi:DNA-binding GntR family transcriptional regulator